MDLTYSEKFKDYIVKQNDLGYPQTIYKFPNGYGASIIKIEYIYFGIEIAVLCFDYVSASNHKKKSAAFNYVQLAGVSCEEGLTDVDSLFKA